MRHYLIFIMMILAGPGFIFAQNTKESYRPFMKRHIDVYKVAYNHSMQEAKQGKDAERTEIGKSANVYSVMGVEQRPLFYDEKSSTMLYTFTSDTEEYPAANSKGCIISSYCQGEGIGNNIFDYWNQTITFNPEASSHYIIKPSAVLVNPDYSEDLDDLYTVIVGQDSTNGSWSKTYFASCKLNGDDYHESFYEMENEDDKVSSSMTVVDDEVYIFGQKYDRVSDYGANQELKHYKGTTEDPSEGYDWNVNAISPDWLIDPDEGFAYALYRTWSAWSSDGDIGYMWMIGVTNDSYEHGVYQPQMYYTTDKGDSWNKIDLDFEDHPQLIDYLSPCEDENGNATTVRPSFLSGDNNFPGAVDPSGRLHLFANVYGTTIGDVLNPQDSMWVDPNAKGGHLFDFIINPSGIHDIIFVSEFKTKPSNNELGEINYDHRLQVGKIIYNDVLITWIDDVISSDYLTYPDIFTWNICEGYGSFEFSDIENLTEGSLYETFYFFTFMAENLSFDYYNYYGINIYLTASLTPSEWANNSPDEPITHFYVNGLGSFYPCVEGVQENTTWSGISVSQNSPNPFSDVSIITIESPTSEPKKIHFEVLDIMGRVIYEDHTKELVSYLEIELNTSVLPIEKGIYFYQLRIGNETFVKKMVVN